MQKRVQTYCARHGIKWEWETNDTLTFLAPAGSVFANDSRSRVLEEADEMTGNEIIDLISVSPSE